MGSSMPLSLMKMTSAGSGVEPPHQTTGWTVHLMNGVAVRAGKLRRQLIERRSKRIGQHDVDLGGASERCGEQHCQGMMARIAAPVGSLILALKIDFASGVVSAPIIALQPPAALAVGCDSGRVTVSVQLGGSRPIIDIGIVQQFDACCRPISVSPLDTSTLTRLFGPP
jgi:hypothetical protein